MLRAFEKAEICADAAERQRLMTIVVVGGGPTGVEMAGACAELFRGPTPAAVGLSEHEDLSQVREVREPEGARAARPQAGRRGLESVEEARPQQGILAEQGVEDILDIEDMTEERAGELIMTARAPWFAEES